MGINNYFSRLLKKGTEYYTNDQEKRLVLTLNAVLYGLFFLIYPLVIGYNIIVKDFTELILLSVVVTFSIWVLRQNQKGKSQLALVASSIIGISLIYPLVYFNNSQMGAPYVSILLSFLAVVFIKNEVWKNGVFIYGFVTFIATNTFQIVTKPFNTVEHIISSFFIFLVFVVFKYVGKLQNNYEEQLEEQNKIIKQQATELVEVQEQKHLSELKVKQNDIEMVVANNSVQVQIKENLVEQLRAVEKSDNSILEIKKIIMELKQQIESQKNISLLQENIEDVNTLFLDKLLEVAPNISKTERELCMYLKLGLSTKEIATLKNTTTNTINVTKTRLRNKLGLKTNTEIVVFLRGF